MKAAAHHKDRRPGAVPIFWHFAAAPTQTYPVSGHVARNVSDFDPFKKGGMGNVPRVQMKEAEKIRAMVSPFYPGAVERKPRAGKAPIFGGSFGLDPE